MAWTQTQLDQGAGIRNCLVLPAVVGLVAAQRIFGRRVPFAARLATQVVLLNQRLLDLYGAITVDLLLSAVSGLA
jgi:hypothetical protein